ncbi:MAG TPA: hypothetical protein PKW56_04210 [Clostridiales bacterium]|nr:hypothetical protein [Clostridiales bacterium]
MTAYTLILPHSLEPRRAEFEGYIVKAMENVRAFAAKYGWSSLVHESFFDKVMIFDVKNDFDRTLLELCKMDPGMVLPESYCGALEERILIAVSPEYYAKVYPQGIEPDSYVKLLTHEICHRLHVRILNGDEEAMGPVWFFEGFAIFAADQFTQSKLKLTEDEIWSIVENSERGSYEKYSHVFKYFVNRIPLKELVVNAKRKDINNWLKR